jgi:hypothetical protein
MNVLNNSDKFGVPGEPRDSYHNLICYYLKFNKIENGNY